MKQFNKDCYMDNIGRVCIKCGYQRNQFDNAPEFACPKCGVVYEKIAKTDIPAPASPPESATVNNNEEADKIAQIKQKAKLASAKQSRENWKNTQQKPKSSSSFFEKNLIPEHSQNKQLFIIIGSILLIVGVFSPVVHIPFAGDMNLFKNGKGDGTFILISAFATLIFAFLQKYSKVFVLSVISLSLVTFDLIHIIYKISSAKTDLKAELAGNPFAGLANMAAESVSLQWGWGILIAGLVLTFIGLFQSKIEQKNR